MSDARTQGEKGFPVHGYPEYPGAPAYVRWSALNEEWAQRNHSQSLDALAARGGMSPEEIIFNVDRRRLDWREMKALTKEEWGKRIQPLEYVP